MPDSATLCFKDPSGEFVPGGELHLCAARRDEDAITIDPSSEPVLRLREGASYEYRLASDRFKLGHSSLIFPSRMPGEQHRGRIDTGIYVGLLALQLLEVESGSCVAEQELEIRSRKLGYESDYRYMLEDIAVRCSELLMELRSPVSQHFEPAEIDDAQTLVQRLSFLKSLLGSEDFQQAVQRIITMPNTQWCEDLRTVDVRHSRRLGRYEVRQFASAGRRMRVPEGHPLRDVMETIPERVEVQGKRDTVDTPENRFVKHALEIFQKTLEEMQEKLKKIGRKPDGWIVSDIQGLVDGLDETLSRGFFREISRPDFLPLGSPVLQRKEGYREVLRAWLQFDLSARLCWKGGEDVYAAGKRDVATLYEYWVFFRLLDVVSEVFELDSPPSQRLIVKTADGFGLKLRAGRHTPLRGKCKAGGRELQLKLSYNRTFARHGKNRSGEYPAKGSWTERMRPDYTLTLWPSVFSEQKAEEQELISHVHFDAKYRVENLHEVFGDDDSKMKGRELHDDLAREAEQEIGGTYKRADLLKMHAYRDAIRRTAGAYVLYPGSEAKEWRGFHEIIPGLGAFPLRPMEKGDGTDELKAFLLAIAEHVSNRATQHEQQTYHTYRIHEQKPPQDGAVHEVLPEKEYASTARQIPPAEISVLIGYYKDPAHLDWMLRGTEKLFNCRADIGRGSLRLESKIANAAYLVLHTDGEIRTDKIYRIVTQGPRVLSAETLVEKGYPHVPLRPYYLVYEVGPLKGGDPLKGYTWNLRDVPGWIPGRGSALPFGVTLTELMNAGTLKD